MYIVTKHIDFCYGHRLLNYQGKCRYLHGHNARVEVDLAAERLDARGMVQDFIDIKQVIKTWIDDTLDHTMLLNRADPLVPVLQQQGERFYLMDDNPTAENIAKLIYTEAHARGLPVVAVRLWETPTSCATYHP
ncbi:MAG: 6-carboxytetrahydropterin synthase [Verrucomicrobiae bacterium]|nr:6-carboxytetrahydropterin synthase [Verrucomicrobiae bacterium]